MLASCSWFLCAEVDVLIEFPGHNSELAALEVWLFGWHLIKVGMSRYKMVQEDVGIPIGAMSTALVKCTPTALLFQKFVFVGSAIFQHLDLEILISDSGDDFMNFSNSAIVRHEKVVVFQIVWFFMFCQWLLRIFCRSLKATTTLWIPWCLDLTSLDTSDLPFSTDIHPDQTFDVVKQFRYRSYIRKSSMQTIVVKWGSRRSLHQAGSKHWGCCQYLACSRK